MSAPGWDDLGNVVPIRGFDKEALKREIPLEWVLYRYGVELQPDSSGTRLEGMCPFGRHHGPKFTVRTTETGEQVAGCWACPDKQQGDLFELIRWLTGEPVDGPFGKLIQYAGEMQVAFRADTAWAARPPVVLKQAEKQDPAVFTRDAGVALQAAIADPRLIKTLIERKAATDPGWRRVTPEYLINSWQVGVEPDSTVSKSVSNPDASPYAQYSQVVLGTRVIVPHFSWSEEAGTWIVRALKTRNAEYGHLFAALGSDLKAALYGVWRMTGKDWVLLCEGEGDAWCAGAVPEIVERMDVLSVPSGVKGMPSAALLAPLAGKNVILAFDGDTDGRLWAGKWVEALKDTAAQTWVAPVEDGLDLSSSPNLLAVVQDAQQVYAGVTASVQGDPDGRPVLLLGEQQDTLHWLWDELGTSGLSGMFLRGDQLVHTAAVGDDGYQAPADDRDSDGPYQVRGVTAVGLAARISDAYSIVKPTGVGRPVFPKSLAEMALSYLDRAPNLRTLRGVTHVPMPRKDGTLITQPGFDRDSGYLYLPTLDVPPIPDDVRGAPLQWATAYLEYLVAEFRWAGAHDKANFFGMLLTPLLRLLTPPPYKFGIIGAHQPGSGKSLLSSIITTVHGGVFRAEMPTEGPELEKLLLSILLTTTAPVVLFDNLSGTVRSSHLAGLLTSADYSGRVLGLSHNASVPNNRLWIGNGNNVALGGDMPRRTLWSVIDPGTPDPHLKTFALNIPEFLRDNRANILRALLIWIEHWRQMGGQVQSIAGDSYSVWIATVREILSVAGVSGTFDHQDSVQQKTGTDDDGWGELVQFVHAITGGQPWTVKQLLEYCESDLLHTNPLHDRLLEVLPDDLQRKIGHNGRLSMISKSLGRWLMYRDGRWANGYSIRCVSKDRTGIKHWASFSYES